MIRNSVPELIASLLERSHISSVAYDTAWLARVYHQKPQKELETGISWLRRNQHIDGSWGSDIFYRQDRIICTLAGFIALAETGDESDVRRIRLAKQFIEEHIDDTARDFIDTIGFPVILSMLTETARRYNLFLPRELETQDRISAKLESLSENDPFKNSIFFSNEALGNRITPIFDTDGCVASSPAASCAALLQDPDTRSLSYVINTISHQGDGGLPAVDFADVFEISWCLTNLRYAGLIKPDDEMIQPVINQLREIWHKSNNEGLAFSSRFHAADLDDTAMAFILLGWSGHTLDARVFERFEGPDYFYCFPNEEDPSLFVNIRLLIALQYMEHPKKEIWQRKVEHAIRNWSDEDYWYDKWHISPYYLTASAIWMLDGILDDVLPEKLTWILDTQNDDGGWGFYGVSTIEETAYCLQAVAHWHLKYGGLEDVVSRGLEFLETAPSHYPAMWIGKCLYTPYKVVLSSILSARHVASQALGL